MQLNSKGHGLISIWAILQGCNAGGGEKTRKVFFGGAFYVLCDIIIIDVGSYIEVVSQSTASPEGMV